MRALSTAASGMLAQQLNVEVISNNIANINTTGYKRQRAEFQDLLYQNLDRPGTQSSSTGTVLPTGIQIGLGVRAGSVYRVTEQGSVNQTGNPFDIAIAGRGYFQVQLPNGDTAYTRAGNFGVSATGQLVTEDGYTVLPAITIPTNAIDISIANDGTVQAILPGAAATPQTLGQIDLATFVNPAGLEAVGDNLLLETAASGTPTVGQPTLDGVGALQQRFIEASNVNPVQEITSLISAQRAYEFNSRVISTTDEMLATITQLT